MANIHAGDVGAVIKVNLGEDITGATLLKIIMKRPVYTDGYKSRDYVVKTAVVEDDTSAVYTTVEGDLPTDGQYEVQVYYADADWQGYSTIGRFSVDRRLYDVLEDIS